MSEKEEIIFMQTRLVRLASKEWHLPVDEIFNIFGKDFCFWMLKMLWQNMILLLGKLRMMRQMQRWPHT